MTLLPEWDDRPITVAHLLNPAFCGEIIKIFSSSYQTSKKNSGMPFQLVFLALPLVLHKGVRESFPRSSSKNFITWVEENQSIKMIVPSLIKRTIAYTKESVMFLMIYDILKFNDQGEIIIIEKTKATKAINEVAECFKKAELLGKWLANSGDSQSIFITLGIKP